jgi:hypothetical protein
MNWMKWNSTMYSTTNRDHVPLFNAGGDATVFVATPAADAAPRAAHPQPGCTIAVACSSSD